MTRPDPSPPKQYKSLWKLRGLTVSQLSRSVTHNLIIYNACGQAAALAFYFLFALFPLILIMMMLFGLFASEDIELQNKLLSHFADVLPASASQLLDSVAHELAARASGGKLALGIIFALSCVSEGIGAMISSLNLAHRIRESRSLLKVRAVALALSLLISILLLMALLIGVASTHFVRQFGIGLRLRPIADLVWRVTQWLAAISFVTASCSLIYHWGPNWKEKTRWQWITPGSTFGMLIWVVASLGFRMYLKFFDTYSLTYGSLGALMILLAWLYVTSLAYVVGAQIDAEIQRGQQRYVK